MNTNRGHKSHSTVPLITPKQNFAEEKFRSKFCRYEISLKQNGEIENYLAEISEIFRVMKWQEDLFRRIDG